MATGKSSDSDLGQRGPCAPLTFLPPHRDVHSFTNGPPAGAKEVVDYSEGQVLREKTPADTDASSGPPPPGPANENEDKSIPVHCWSSPEGSTFSVRDKNYLVDRRKVQVSPTCLVTIISVRFNPPSSYGNSITTAPEQLFVYIGSRSTFQDKWPCCG